ncbi:MAG: hypothetical protein OEZ38_14410 [Gammaproteobacteria bacterium]|nr:hypothetical protein [Gammaproteobacteria bacterium]
MAKSKKGKWKLSKSEVTWGTSLLWRDNDPFDIEIKPDEKHASPPGGKGYRQKLSQSRNFKNKNECITMTHEPTGIQSHGRIRGFYTRNEDQQLHQALINALFQNLEEKVAKHFKISGR